MKNPSGKSKTRSTRSLLFLGVTAIVLSIAISIWRYYEHKIANNAIHRTVIEKSKGMYSIRYDSLAIDLALGSLHAKNVQLVPDTAMYVQLARNKKAPSATIRVFIPSLTLLRIRTPKALLKKEIEGGKIEIDGPTIEIELNHFMEDTSGYRPSRELYKLLLGNLLSIKIDTIAITHAQLLVKNMGSIDTVFKGEDLSLGMSSLLIDSMSKDDSSRILFSKNIEAECSEIILPSRRKDYKLKVEKLKFISHNNSFKIGRIILAPQLSEEAFVRAARLQKDRYDLSINGLTLINIDRESLWQKRVIADSLIISESVWKIYRDLSYPRDTLSRVGKYPFQDLMHLSLPLLIKKMVVRNSFIEYKEKNAKSKSAGKVQFYAVRAAISNVTNIRPAIRQNNACVLDFNSKFLNKTPLQVRLTMFLRDPLGKFAMAGNLGAFDAQLLNPLTQPMGLARIDKGMIDTLYFNFDGDDYGSKGTITLLYKNLKVSLLKKDGDENKYDKKILPSFVAGMIIKSDNPSGNGDARMETFYYKRDINKSFFNLLWKSVFTGVKQTAGVK